MSAGAMAPAPSVRGRSLRGHLRAVAAVDALGRTHLRRQSFQAPLHLSKPHSDAGALVVNVVSPTAGLFDGDEVELAVEIETGARVVITTPSACRIHQARGDRAAVMRQSITVRDGGFAEFVPELIIPHRGARYQQETTLTADAGGTLVFFEWLAPGRVAHGEIFEFASLRWQTDVWHAGQLAARERYHLQPDDSSLAGLRTLFPAGHYLSAFIIGTVPVPQEAIEALDQPDVALGCGRLATGGWTIKAVCRDGLVARRTLGRLRGMIYDALGQVPPSLRRW